MTGRVAAYQVLLPLSTNNSTLQTQLKLTVGTSSTSSDTVPVSGFLLFDLDTNSTSTQISLRNFDIHALRNFYFTNTILFISKLYTTISNTVVFDGGPGLRSLSYPVTAGSYTLTNISVLLKGAAGYSGIASGSGVLTSSTPQNLTNTSGTWQTVNGTNSTHVAFAFVFQEITVTNAIGVVKIDISGAGSLNAQIPTNALPPAAPTLAGSASGGQFVIHWPSSFWPTPAATNTPVGYWPYRTTDLSATAVWEPEPATVIDDGTQSTVNVPMDSAQFFYRLEWK